MEGKQAPISGLTVALLGPVRIGLAGQEMAPVGQPLLRVLSGMLGLAAGRAVSVPALIDGLWGQDATPEREKNLHSRISALRRLLEQAEPGRGGSRVVRSGDGYLLRLDPGCLDVEEFTVLAERGRGLVRAGDKAGAAGLFRDALALWRGPALQDAAPWCSWLAGEAGRLEEARAAVAEEQADCDLALGRYGEAVAGIASVAEAFPLRERLAGQLMVALWLCGRRGEALAAYDRTRRVLASELGLDPGPDLRRLHARLLADDPSLAAPAAGTGVLPAAGPARGRGPAEEVLAAGADRRAALAAVISGMPAVPAGVLVPRELPADVGAFTGREVELAELDLLLPDTAGKQDGAAGPVVISAVAGTGGVGKTALAVRWAHRVAVAFPGGQLYVNLRGYDPGEPVDPGQVLAGFLRALGVPDDDIPLEEAERAARYRSLLSGRRVLVVLDNAASEEQVRPLLPGTGMAMVVVTSRDSLPGLVARDGARRLDLDLLPLEEAVTLLRTLVGARADTEPAAAEALASLCARLPLALRLAAELAISRPDTPLAVLAAELAGEDRQLQLLDAGGDPRAALAGVFSWSYRRLPPDAARLFRLLGLHPGADWDQYAAAALTGTTIARADRLVAVLARAHLVQAGPGRYGIHNLLRAYAAGLAASQDGEPASRAALTGLFDYYLSACAAAIDCLAPAEREDRPSPPAVSSPVPQLDNRDAARAWLQAELPTLTVVAAHTARHGWPSHTTRLAATLFRYLRDGYSIEGLAICGYALSAARDQDDLTGQAFMLATLGLHIRLHRTRAAALNRHALALALATKDRPGEALVLLNLGNCYAAQACYPQAARCYRRALALSRTLGDQVGEARALCLVGTVYYWQGRYAQAADYLEHTLALSGETTNFHTESSALLRLGEVCYRQGRYQQATDYLDSAVSLSRELGMRGGEGTALARLGQVCHRQGHYDQAAAYYQQALARSRDSGDLFSEADVLNGMGQTLLATGQPDQARSCHSTAMSIGDDLEQARSLGGLGQVSYWQGHHDQAVDYHQQALARYQEIGDPAGKADAANSLGQALLATGHPEQARSCHTTALTLARRTGDRYQQARAHHGLAAVCQASADAGTAGRHWRRALEIYTDLGVPDASHVPLRPDHLAAVNSDSSS